MKINEVLEIKFYCDDLDKDLTIREYLHALLLTLWKEGEGFSGKRPFGNGAWKYDLYTALVAGGAIEGDIDDEGYADNYCIQEASGMISACIDYIFKEG